MNRLRTSWFDKLMVRQAHHDKFAMIVISIVTLSLSKGEFKVYKEIN